MARRERKKGPGPAREGPRLAGKGRGRSPRPDTEAELARRLERVRTSLYRLHGDLRYFLASPPGHRARLRAELDWPDVGYITSLARSLAAEDRFRDWVRFNSYMKSA